jgi:hypothetical protein
LHAYAQFDIFNTLLKQTNWCKNSFQCIFVQWCSIKQTKNTWYLLCIIVHCNCNVNNVEMHACVYVAVNLMYVVVSVETKVWYIQFQEQNYNQKDNYSHMITWTDHTLSQKNTNKQNNHIETNNITWNLLTSKTNIWNNMNWMNWNDQLDNNLLLFVTFSFKIHFPWNTNEDFTLSKMEANPDWKLTKQKTT